MKIMYHKLSLSIGLISLTALAATGIASAAATTTTTTTSDTTRIQTIITRGDQEISRRLTSLNGLSAKISGASKLTAADKATLSAEVSTEVSGLTTLKAKLDAETTLAGAKADAQSIVSDYRVYALIVPKIELVRAADDQQVTESKLTALATKLQTRLTTAKNNGKDVTALQAKLTDMTSQIANAQSISSGIEAKVINLQPSDYNSDHSVLSGDAAQLKTAHADNQAAYSDAKAIVAGVKSL